MVGLIPRKPKDKWDFFLNALSHSEQTYLLRTMTSRADLDRMVEEMMARPRSDKPGKRIGFVWEEAGKAADAYGGGGWMELRDMLVRFHEYMSARENCN